LYYLIQEKLRLIAIDALLENTVAAAHFRSCSRILQNIATSTAATIAAATTAALTKAVE
jgi:hypothetical protein